MSRLSYVALAAIMPIAPAALSHPGPRVWVNVEPGRKVTTYQGPYPPGDPANYARSRVFSQAMTGEDDIWYSDFPGFQPVPGGTIPTNTSFSYDITGPVLFYEPAAGAQDARFRTVARHFGASPPAPQFGVTNELFQSKITGNGFVPGDLAFAYNGGAGDHNHLTYTLLGDGATAGGGADGIYVLQLRLTAAGLEPSDTYFLLLGKNATAGQLSDASSLAARTIVLPGDANGDGVVTFADFQHLERGFGKTDAGWGQGDFNFDGIVGGADFVTLRDNFGRRRDGGTASIAPLPAAAQVPEPTCITLVIGALISLSTRRARFRGGSSCSAVGR